MVTDEGRLKVLDFGLAKLREESPRRRARGHDGRPRRSRARDASSAPWPTCRPSRRRASRSMRARTSSRSASCCSRWPPGEKPFKGDTHMSLLSAILKDTPLVGHRSAPGPPARGRADPETLPREGSRTSAIRRPRTCATICGSLKEDLDTRRRQDAPRRVTHVSQTGRGCRCRRGAAVSPWRSPVAAVVAVAAAGGWWYARRRAATAAPAFATITMRRLTNTGTARIAAISPDGRYVVHVDGNFDKPSLWMRQASTASSVQIVPPMTGHTRGSRSRRMARPCCTCSAPRDGAGRRRCFRSRCWAARRASWSRTSARRPLLAGWQTHGVHPRAGRRRTSHRARQRGWHEPAPSGVARRTRTRTPRRASHGLRTGR